MPRSELDLQLTRIDLLFAEANAFVPATLQSATAFRADLAGLFVVTIAATYESCVKEILINFASRHHVAFGNYTSQRYAKLNSRINVSDLHLYAKTFGPSVGVNFKAELKRSKDAINGRIGKDIEKSYEQILSWRHDFAHAGKRNTTLEEAAATHTIAKRVLYAFGKAFD
jgi:hypothetical protein